MSKLSFLKQIYSLLKSANPESLNLSMADVHHRGLFSLVIEGIEFGKLTRVFIADEKVSPFAVQLHSHRYPIRLTSIKGTINHYVAKPTDESGCDVVSLSEFNYKSPLNGGEGLSYVRESNFLIKDYLLPIGASLDMTSQEIHTVSCGKGSI